MLTKFVKNTFSLSVGSALAQGISVLTPLVLINLYSPSTVGQYSFVVICSSILAIFFTLRSEGLLIAIGDDNEFNTVASLALKSTLYLSVASQAILIGIYLLDLWPFYKGFVIIPTVAGVLSLFQISREVQIRNEKYARESFLNATKAFLNFLGQFLLGLSFANFFSLIFPKILTDLYYALITLSQSLPKVSDHSDFEKVIVKYKRICLQLFAGRLLMNLSNNSISLYWPYFFSFQSLGLVYLSLKITQLPGNILGENLSKVFEKLFVKGQLANLKTTLLKSFLILFLLSLVGTLMIYFFLGSIINLIGKNSWNNADYYSLLFSPIIFTTLVSAGLSSCFKLSNRIFQLNILDFIEGVVKNITVITIGIYYLENDYLMILSYSIMTFAFCVFKSMYVLIYIPSEEFKALGLETQSVVDFQSRPAPRP